MENADKFHRGAPYATYPISDQETLEEDSLVNIPNLNDIIEAKEWVDFHEV